MNMLIARMRSIRMVPGPARAIFDVIQGLGGKCSLMNLRKAMDMTDSKGQMRVTSAINDLKKGGWIRKNERGYFEIIKKNNNPNDMQNKIWRSIKIRRQFTLIDLCLDSDASLNYTRRYVQFLVKKGYVAKNGYMTVDMGSKTKNRRTFQPIREKMSVVAPCYSRKKPPSQQEEKWLEIKGLVWKLIRLTLICDWKVMPEIKEAVKQLETVVEQF